MAFLLGRRASRLAARAQTQASWTSSSATSASSEAVSGSSANSETCRFKRSYSIFYYIFKTRIRPDDRFKEVIRREGQIFGEIIQNYIAKL